MLIFEAISIALILVLSFIILGKGGASHHLTMLPFGLGGNKISSVGLAAVFAFLSFAGFEGASTLGEETRNPRRAIPVAIASAVFLTGIFYVFVSYTQSVGFGLNAAGVHAFANSSAPLGDLAKQYVSNSFAAAIMFGATMSAFSSGLGCVTTGSRLFFSMGRDGFIHPNIARVHAKYGTPTVAIFIVVIVGLVQVLPLAGFAGTSVFGWLGTVGVLALLLAYLVTNIGGIAYFVRNGKWRGAILIVPVLAIAMLAYTLYSNVFPIPSAPYNYFPYVVILWIVIGLFVVLFNPALARNFTTRMLAESDSVSGQG